jgi:hypothetical protein
MKFTDTDKKVIMEHWIVKELVAGQVHTYLIWHTEYDIRHKVLDQFVTISTKIYWVKE